MAPTRSRAGAVGLHLARSAGRQHDLVDNVDDTVRGTDVGGVYLRCDELACGIPAGSRFGKRDIRPSAKCQLLLLASEPVDHPPALAAVRIDDQQQPAAVTMFLGLGVRI